VIVKTFSLNTDTSKPEKTRRLETRLWLHSPRGWDGYTYLWNEEQTDATLLGEDSFVREFEIQTPDGAKKQEWYFPSRSDCHACHTHNAGFVLGLNTRQTNRPDSFTKSASVAPSGNQLDRFSQMGMFAKHTPPAEGLEAFPDWERAIERKPGGDDSKETLERLSRAYLDVNCALCHSPGGFGTAQGSKADLNFHRSMEQAFPPPPKGAAGVKRFLVKGSPERSEMIEHMEARKRKEQMPPLATNIPDKQAIEVISRWIEKLAE